MPTSLDLHILVTMLGGVCSDDGVGGVMGRHLGVAAPGKDVFFMLAWAEYLVDFGATDQATMKMFYSLVGGGVERLWNLVFEYKRTLAIH